MVAPSGQAGMSNEGFDMGTDCHTGFVVEYKPPEWGHWMPALATPARADGETLTVEFVMMGVAHQHNVLRSSTLLSPLGIHEHGLPPSFWARPSKTRPGQLAFSDKVTGARYGSSALAWKVHLERVLRMESLPTVCDLNPSSNKCRFSWPVPKDDMRIEEETSPAHSLSPPCPSLVPNGAQDKAHEYTSDVCFASDVFAELMAAPSPAAVPLAVFAKTDHDVENEGRHSKTTRKVADNKERKLVELPQPTPATQPQPHTPQNISHSPQKQFRQIPTVTTEALPADTGLTFEATPRNSVQHEQVRVAELEGALEASRDRVQELEASLEKSTAVVKSHDANTDACNHMPHFGMTFQSRCGSAKSLVSRCGGSESEHSMVLPSQSQGGETTSVFSDAGSAQESFTRVEELLDRIVAEEQLLKKAIEIADLRRSAHKMSGNCEALEDCEPRFAELQQEIKDREEKLVELSQVHQQKEEDLEKLRLSLQSREQANTVFEEHLRGWETQLSTKPVVLRQARHSVPCGTPPKVPRPTTRPLSARGRTATSKFLPGSATVPACGGDGRFAMQAAAEVAAVARNGPSRRSRSVHSRTPGGCSPDGGRGFRTPRRSLSPTLPTFVPRCRSPSSSVVCSSIRSGCSTTAPSESGRTESSLSFPCYASGKNVLQVQHYTGTLSHPAFGSDEISIEVTLHGSCTGKWKALDQSQEITVQRDGKRISLTDKLGSTTLDGRESIGGMLIGVVIQQGLAGGRFRLRPCRAALLKKRSIQTHVQVPVVPVTETVTRTHWRAVGIPKRVEVQSTGEVAWRTSYQVAYA